MSIIALSSVCILIGALFLAAAPTPDEKENGRNGVKFTYAAQVTCGFDPPSGILRIMPGQYATAVHVHNPTAESVTFRKRLALTFPDSDFGSDGSAGFGGIFDRLFRGTDPRGGDPRAAGGQRPAAHQPQRGQDAPTLARRIRCDPLQTSRSTLYST